MSRLIESVRRVVALQNGRLILARAGRESRSETEKEQLPIAASARETRNRVYERRVLEPLTRFWLGNTEGDRAGYQVRGVGTLPVRGTSGAVLAGRGSEVVRRVSGTVLSGIAAQGLLPDVDPRESSARSQEGVKVRWAGPRDWS